MEERSNHLFLTKSLDYFLQMSETMSYTQAAQILGISQPALTQQIKKLERVVGAPLFYSIGKQLHMTEAGQTLLRTTHTVNTILVNASDEIQQTVSADKGTIRLGVLSSIEEKVFTDYAVAYYLANPNVQISMYLLDRTEIWEKLENNEIDLAIMYLPDKSIKNWESYKMERIIMEELLLATKNDERSFDDTSIPLKETVKFPWVFYPDSHYVHDLLQEEFKNQLSDLPEAVGVFTSSHQLHHFCKLTGSFTALPETYVRAHNQSGELKTIPFNPPIKFPLAFVFREEKKKSPRISQYIDDFKEFLNQEDYMSRLTSDSTDFYPTNQQKKRRE